MLLNINQISRYQNKFEKQIWSIYFLINVLFQMTTHGLSWVLWMIMEAILTQAILRHVLLKMRREIIWNNETNKLKPVLTNNWFLYDYFLLFISQNDTFHVSTGHTRPKNVHSNTRWLLSNNIFIEPLRHSSVILLNLVPVKRLSTTSTNAQTNSTKIEK